MKIAICDDNIKDIEFLESSISTHPSTHEVTSFTSAVPLLRCIDNGEKFNLLFLDVQMPDADGWLIAKKLKDAKMSIYIAMITVLGDYIHDCFDRVDWFAVKPVRPDRIHTILDKAQEKLFPFVFNFRADNNMISLTAPEIIYIEINRNDLSIYTTNNYFKIRLSISETMKILSKSPCFAQPHQSYIVNMDYHDSIENAEILLTTGVKLPISRRYKKNYLFQLGSYIRRNSING